MSAIRNEYLDTVIHVATTIRDTCKSEEKNSPRRNKIIQKEMEVDLVTQVSCLVPQIEQGLLLPMNEETLRRLEAKHPIEVEAKE